MDLGGSDGGFDGGFGDNEGLPPKKRSLPADLPRSLDDRRHVPTDLVPETEMYDGWQGVSRFLNPPSLPHPSRAPRHCSNTLQNVRRSQLTSRVRARSQGNLSF